MLNSLFTFIRTFGKSNFRISEEFSDIQINQLIQPIKQYEPSKEFSTPPNVIIFILESFGREYWGSMNRSRGIENFESFTPFLDSLAKHSLVFSNGFTNSRKSIHGMPAVLAGIPSFDVAYTSSQYSNQSLQSLVSIAEEMEYSTSFFSWSTQWVNGILGLL